jgi:hypothetical protein
MEAGAHFHEDPRHMAAPPPVSTAPRRTDEGAGWIAFAGAYLIMAGFMNGAWGLVALVNKSAFTENGLIWSNLNTWGWIALVSGVLQGIAGLLVLAQRFAGQWLAGIFATIGIFVSFLSAGAYPLWSVIALAANGLVVWAVTVHGDEFD